MLRVDAEQRAHLPPELEPMRPAQRHEPVEDCVFACISRVRRDSGEPILIATRQDIEDLVADGDAYPCGADLAFAPVPVDPKGQILNGEVGRPLS
jgi:hypothetical protein